MTTPTLGAGTVITALGVVAGGLLPGCNKMSASVLDESAGMNGGFEIVKSGLPVNWIVYTPKTLLTGDYDLIIDTTQYRAGKQSLKFIVRECSPDGGWRSPGLSKEYDATPGRSYTVGFWVKNDGAEFRAKIGGVSATRSQYETIVRSSETIAAWRHYEQDYTVPQGFNRIRFELNVLRPGTFWIDDVTISGVK